MTQEDGPESRRKSRSPGEIPTHVISLRAERELGPDQISTLAVLAIIVALLGTTCMPLWTVLAILASNQPEQAHVETSSDPRGTSRPAAQATTAASPKRPEIPVISLGMVLVFFLIAVAGIVGGFGTLLRREWGRRTLMVYAALVLLYLAAAVYLRLRFGIEGMTGTAPTPSALSLNFTCVFGAIMLVATLMIAILRYFSRPYIAARFR